MAVQVIKPQPTSAHRKENTRVQKSGFAEMIDLRSSRKLSEGVVDA